MLSRRELTRTNLLTISTRSVLHDLTDLRKLLHKTRHATGANTHHVLPHQHLTGGHIRGTNADSRHSAHSLIHQLRSLGSHHLHEHAERASLSQRHRILTNTLRRITAALHTETAQSMLRLRGETNMRHHRNTGTHQGTNPLSHRRISLNLDRVRAALLHQANSARHRLLRGLLIRTKRQICNHHGAGGTARNRRNQRNHLIQGNGQGGFVTEHHIRR